MKHFVLLVLFFSYGASCPAQSLFFDNLENSAWIADESLNASTIRNVKQIALTRLKIPQDALTTSRTIWTFEGQLVIRHYDATLDKDSIVTKCDYRIDREKGRLNIKPNAGANAKFDIVIVSTANFVLLIRRKK